MSIIDRGFSELSTAEFHDLVKLRVDVFVVEQECSYPELDGRDDESGTRHVWVTDAHGPCAYLRVLDDGDARRVGRVVTRADARGRGLAATLVDHVIATCPGPWVLDSQSRLVGWYGARGFVVSGAEFTEDGISHVPMRRDA